MEGPNDDSSPQATHRGGLPNHMKKPNDVGAVRPWELVLVSVLVMAMIGGAATAIVLGTRSDPLPPGTAIDPSTGKVVSTFRLPTPPPHTLFPGGDAQEYAFLLQELTARGAAFQPIVDVLPKDLSGLVSTSTDPMVQAAVWLTSIDKTDAKEVALVRFALASLYYALGGDKWTDKSNWLSPNRHYCDWHGIYCCPALMASPSCSHNGLDFDKIIELDLYRNNLVGTLPISIGLLPDVHSIFMNNNQISGALTTALGELPKLHRLYFQHNLFSGSIPTKAQLDKSGLIGTLPFCFCVFGLV
jgi:hypothetical protein